MYEGSLAPFFCRTDFVRGASALLSTHTAGCGKARKNIGRRGAVLWKKTITCRHERDRARKTQGAGRIGQIRRLVRVERRYAPASRRAVWAARRGGAYATTFTADGRCVSLLKIMLTNRLHLRLRLLHQPAQQRHPAGGFHAGRAGRSDHRVLPAQLHRRTVSLVRACVRNPDYTMERMVRVARDLRTVHRFNGYIHLKSIPGGQSRTGGRGGASTPTVMSVNIEIPTERQPAAAGSRQEL